ncbi:MAG TPA: gamma-glutamyltransferase [Phycisphaerae bacterium]|nr:gamma-glutamyltransferase [Phycisphaerae bacterium]HRR84557.1 gamma-glutamyltransferase [Phycisphaerae bacterium]
MRNKPPARLKTCEAAARGGTAETDPPADLMAGRREPRRASWRTCVFGLVSVLALVPIGCGAAPPTYHARPWVKSGRQAMVASDSIHASRAGGEILRSGGNAVDAAVATSLALAVTRPYSTGLGGGGFFMVRLAATGEVFVLDARECAPAAATPDLFTKSRERWPDAPPLSRFGGLAVGVPGLPAGHRALLERFGTRPLKDLVEPARSLAADGFAIDADFRGAVRSTLQQIDDHPGLPQRTAALRRALLFDGRVPEIGTILIQPQLARTLQALSAQGLASFYTGDMAAQLVQAVRQDRGVMTAGDLTAYKPVWRKPIRVQYREHFDLFLMPPPSSGGICIAEALSILERWDLRAIHRKDPGLAAHLTVEAMKHAFADRARFLGDADHANVPVAVLTGKPHARSLAARINEQSVADSAAYGQTEPTSALPEDSGTSHFCVVDRWGNIVSATETINTGFGSLLYVEDLGIVLNNEMDDFTTEPGQVNVYGLRQSDANLVGPHKRPLSCMSPTIVLKDDRPFLAVGGSGGPRIISSVLQVLLNVLEYDLGPGEAVAEPRYHHQWQPDLLYRNDYPADHPVVIGLKRRGHQISDQKRGAVVQAVLVSDDGLIGASDPRKGGRPDGY